MKKIFTLCFLIFQNILLFAGSPTVPSSNFVFSSIDGTKFSVRFTSGNGSSRIVVMKAGSPVTGLPVNGTDYSSNMSFGTPASAFISPDQFVVYKGSSNAFIVTNLLPHTTYYISVFEYNGSAANTEYLMTALTGNQSTATTPATQTHTITFSNKTGNSVKLNWINGSGESRLILARKGAPVNVSPADLMDYSASADFGTGNVLNGDNYVVYKNSGNTITINNLEPNTIYHFAFFEKNGSSSPVYLSPAATASITTNAGPTVATQSLNFSSQEGNRFTIGCSRGNGSKRLFIARKGAAVTAIPANGASYAASTSFGAGYEIAPGEFVFNNSSEVAVILTNLDPASTYYFRSFEFDTDASGNTYYLTSNPASGSYSTASSPAPATNITFSNVTGNSMLIKYTAGSGGYRMMIIKEGSSADAVPADLIRYTGSGNFGSGTQLTPGNFVVNGGANGTQTSVTNLRPGFTYHIAVYEFNGNNYPVYAATAATASITMPAEPTTPSVSFSASSIEGNSFHAFWNNGDGTRRIVIARKNAIVTVVPTDGSTYTANASFGQGTQIATGHYIVYDGINSNFELKNLEPGSIYHLAIFEYNLSGTTPDYLTTAWLAGNTTTLSAPSQQISNVTATAIQATQATFNFAAGNGNGRIFIMRAGTAVNADPMDFTSYSYSNTFGIVEIGTGNYIIQKTTATNNFTITGLTANTQYYVAAYEYNGSAGPLFNRPSFTMNFTTAAGSGVVAPTVAASTPVFNNVEGNRITFNWTEGNGSSRIVVARAGAPVAFQPANGSTYTANAAFGNGTDVGSNEYVVYNGNSGSLTLTNILPATAYYFAVYEYNGTGVNTRYLTSSYLAADRSTLSAPVAGSSNLNSGFTSHSITLNWQNGSGTNRMVVLKEDEAVSSMPADLSAYPANTIFGNGAQIGTGEYVVYTGSGNSVTVTGLTAGKTYHFTVFEYNGTTGPVYNTTQLLSGSATTSSTLPVTWLYFKGNEQNNMVKLEWGTATELNAAYFVIERNINNTGFQSLDTINAAGNSSVNQHYSYTDAIPMVSNIHYRLKQVDIDGRFDYSQVVSFRITTVGKPGFTLFPNPATSSVKINMNSNTNATALLIYDITGRLLQQQPVNNNSLLVNIDNLKQGIYYFVLQDGANRYTQKVIKQ